MPGEELLPTRCAICGTQGNAAEVYPARLGAVAFSSQVFSARRTPDGMHYRLVKCRSCGLVRSDPAAGSERLARIYSESSFDYLGEVENLRATYGRYLRVLERYGGGRGTLLEIGCGNGFFLQEALQQGYSGVFGVEPSTRAVAVADPLLQPRIHVGVLRPGLFAPESFDVICLFQVLDHLPNAAEVLETCLQLLKPDGLVLCLNHNVDAVSSRLLGEASPIVDVEHTYLFGPKTLRRLFESCGFRVEEVEAAWNRYSLSYLVRLLPLPTFLKRPLVSLARSKPGRLAISVPLGNSYLIARRASGAIRRTESNLALDAPCRVSRHEES
jgi:SAM-dependent methyltransferase